MRRAQAEREQKIASSRQLAAQASSLKADQPDLALLLSLEGIDLLKENGLTDTIEPLASLVDALASSSLLGTLYEPSGYATDLGFSQDGGRMATLGQDGSIHLWEVSTSRLITLTLPGDVSGMDLSPDGSLVAISDYFGSVRVWNTASGDFIEAPTPGAGSPSNLAFSPSGDSLALARYVIWETAAGLKCSRDRPVWPGLAFSQEEPWRLPTRMKLVGS
jgi:WD40 repeat protein